MSGGRRKASRMCFARAVRNDAAGSKRAEQLRGCGHVTGFLDRREAEMPKPADRKRLSRRRTFSAAGLSAVRRACPAVFPARCPSGIGLGQSQRPRFFLESAIGIRLGLAPAKADGPRLNGIDRFCKTACRPSPLGCRPALPAGRSFSPAAHRFAEFARFPTLAEILQLCSRSHATALYKQPASTTVGTLVLPPNPRFQKQKQLVFFSEVFEGFQGTFFKKSPEQGAGQRPARTASFRPRRKSCAVTRLLPRYCSAALFILFPAAAGAGVVRRRRAGWRWRPSAPACARCPFWGRRGTGCAPYPRGCCRSSRQTSRCPRACIR